MPVAGSAWACPKLVEALRLAKGSDRAAALLELLSEKERLANGGCCSMHTPGTWLPVRSENIFSWQQQIQTVLGAAEANEGLRQAKKCRKKHKPKQLRNCMVVLTHFLLGPDPSGYSSVHAETGREAHCSCVKGWKASSVSRRTAAIGSR